MLEFDTAFNNEENNRILKAQKLNQQLASEDNSWQEFTALSDVETPSGLAKSDTSAQALIDHERLVDGFGFDTLQVLQKNYTLRGTHELDLDGFEKSFPLATRLMKAERNRQSDQLSKSTGGPVEEMTHFFQRYEHLMKESVKKTIRMAIQCMDFPLYFRLMNDALASA